VTEGKSRVAEIRKSKSEILNKFKTENPNVHNEFAGNACSRTPIRRLPHMPELAAAIRDARITERIWCAAAPC
jgi:hypothetical protein